jgi:uncharacterized radical SAM protein YgiQ
VFLPATIDEIKKLKWSKPDIILVSGDAYIDSPFMGVSIIGNYLSAKGFKTAIIPQPDINGADIAALGEPRLFWGVSAGAMDSFVSNWTALNKFRNEDDLTPGGINNRRPNRASIVYSNLIRRFFKNTKPIVLGGLEASLRRISHYDFQDNSIRRSLLFDAKADILIYGMGEKAVLELAQALNEGRNWQDIKGLCFISKEKKEKALEINSFEECLQNKDVFFNSFKLFYENAVSANPQILLQKHSERYLIQNPPQPPLTQKELDAVYDLDFNRQVHPHCAALGAVKAQETVKFSITSHRGCFGECNFCSIAVHQGKQTISRSRSSIIKEAKKIAALKDFKGCISDIGGPSANMFGCACSQNKNAGSCRDKRCLFPDICKNLVFGHKEQIELFSEVSKIDRVKKVFVSSGIRHDLIIADKECGAMWLDKVLQNHTSGQLKIAPEHINGDVLSFMGKPKAADLFDFLKLFEEMNKKTAARGIPLKAERPSFKRFLTYYFIAAHPGCSGKEMGELKLWTDRNLKFTPQQVQIFTPLPSTWSAAMYFAEKDLQGNKIFVEKDRNEKQKQKRLITGDNKKGSWDF